MKQLGVSATYQCVIAFLFIYTIAFCFNAEGVSIDWNSPELGTSRIVNHARVKISGKTEPYSKINISRKRLTIYQNQKLIGLQEHKFILDQDLWFNLRHACDVRSLKNKKIIGRMHTKYPFVVTNFREGISNSDIKIITEIRQNEVEAIIDRDCLSDEINLVPDLYDEVAGFPNLPPEIVQVDKNGTFTYYTDVPEGIIQQSVTIESAKGEKKDFIISFSVPRDAVITWDDMYVYLDQWLPKFWFGVGINLLDYNQQGSSSTDQLNFQSFEGPDFRISGSYPIARRYSVVSSYKQTPGLAEAGANAGFSLLENKYSWDTLGLEVVHHPTKWEKKFLNGIHNFGARIGVQHHWFPFFTANQINQFALVDGQATMLSVGLEGNYYRNKIIYYETLLRYQYPVASGSDFELIPQLSVDGSVGAIYRLRPGLNIGVYWYGQFHSFDYKIKNSVRETTDAGTQDIFYSSVELRLGYTFGIQKYKKFVEKIKEKRINFKD